MDVQYAVREDQDAQIHEVFEERKTVRIRLQPDLYTANGGERGSYVSWKGVYWKIDCSTPGEALALRGALRAFFSACGQAGPDRVRMLLETTDLSS